jgi:transcriptional regulator with XRE-family HTH domain
MSIEQLLLSQVIEAARAAQLDQARLAHAAGVAPETISRAKKRGTIDLSTLQALAQAAGLTLTLSGSALAPAVLKEEPARRSSLAAPSRGLAWSNAAISDEALVRNALKKGSFNLVLEAVFEHGLHFVQRQWALMRSDVDVGLSARALADISRKLANIERGLSHAAA